MTRDDRSHLARAVALAQGVVVTASPNPGVGCVLVRDGVVVGEGATRPVGGPHAEVVALDLAGPSARGATAYVSLEPCGHHGRTPPCTDALVRGGVARVVFAHPDPDPIAGGGAVRLRDAGVEVDGPDAVDDPIRAAVAGQLEGFLTRLRDQRPHVTLKLAQTADGDLTDPSGERWLTGPTARGAVHRWRAERDAVLVGSGTVLADDPRLDVRHVAAVRQPRPVVLDARLRTPVDARVVRPGAIVVTAEHAETDRARTERRRALVERGVEVLEVPPAPAGGVLLPAALRALGSHGVTSVLAEPGRTLADALLADDLVDRLVLHVAVDRGVGRARRARPVPDGGRWCTERAGGAGSDMILHLVPWSRRVDPGGVATEPT